MNGKRVPKYDSAKILEKGVTEKKMISVASDYERRSSKGDKGENILANLAKKHNRDPRTIQRWVSEGRQLMHRKLGKETRYWQDLRRHFEELIPVARMLARNVQNTLLVLPLYEGSNDVEPIGNIFVGWGFWREGTYPPGLDEGASIEYEEALKREEVDPYLAECLFAHYEDEFGKLPFKSWGEATTEEVNQDLAKNLALLTHSEQFRFCPSCEACEVIVGYQSPILRK